MEWELVMQAPKRCVAAIICIREFELISGDIPEVKAFLSDLRNILTGSVSSERWESDAAVIEGAHEPESE